MNLAWNPTTDSTVVGFNIYYGGASATYTNEFSVGMATNATISGLVPGATYYFAATTYNAAGLESPFSAEISYLVPPIVPVGNQPPTLNAIGSFSVNENAGLQTVGLSGITSGSTNENQTLTVTASSSNTNLVPNPAVNYTSANTTGFLTFAPVSNANGSVTITVTVNDGGASNNIVTQTFTVTVKPVNQPPTLNAIGSFSINENAGLQTVNLSGISSGAANENQTLTVTATSSNTGLIPNPTVNYTSANTTGFLTFAPATNANGSATITVKVNDGGTSNNIVTQTFTVTVNPVNQPPTLNAIANLGINGNVGLQTVNLSGISSGAANENQTLTITASSSNTNLISPPTVNYTNGSTTGTLTFMPVTNANNSATIAVTVNDGGTSNNIVTQTFTVNVLAVGDQTAPTNQITAPTSNQQWTNGTFTVTGKAGDNVAVSAVYCSLNGSGWISATSANRWTNWTTSVTLTPGTNTVQAYAVDTSGNVSATNTVKFVYVVLKPLTVQIIGLGTVKTNCGTLNPNYSTGTLLAINENYAMTASAVTNLGFGFTNWTDGSSKVLTNGATLRFTMQPNLVLKANFVDVQKPVVSVVSPALNQQWTNGTFTVTGKAGDNVAVGAVYCSLNGSGWTAVTTTNGWTNWTAGVTLTPGTNMVQAYAVDTSGNISATNTASFEYVVLTPMTVQIVGRGTVKTNYNGMLLAINENYTMTASAVTNSGFGFTNWTDGSSNVLTNGATLRFTMQPNLVLKANFVDVQKPVVSIVSPASNQQWTNGTFTVTGKAGDNVAVGAVYCSLNGSGWMAVTTTNGWTNWTAGVTLTPGTNTVRAYAVDTSGNISATNTVSFEYVVLTPMTVQIVGRGTVKTNYNGMLLAINENYTMTASAVMNSGFGFTNWTDGSSNVLTNGATLRFTMQPNLTYTANFVDVQKPVVSIVSPASNQQWTNGTFTVTGKAGDNVAVGAVYCSLNGSGWTAVTTTNGWTNWTAGVTLTPGTNM
ncbi:MAG: Ig-like domain-containing protein, partial [Limisphaerales bacterium]